MKLPVFFHRPRRTDILLLVLAVLGLVLVPQVHATGITFKSFCHIGINTGSTINCTISGVATADTIIVNIFGVGVFNGFTVTDGQSNTYTEQIFSLTGSGAGASTYIFATLSTASSGSLVVTVATGGPSRAYGFTASDYNNVIGFGKTGTDENDAAGASGTSTVSLTGTGATSAFIDDFLLFTISTPTVTANNGQTIRDNGVTAFCSASACTAADSTSPILGWSWSGGGAGCSPPPACFMSHSALELTGAASGTINTVFQCYGNCGNPPITLVNTNSTHTVNFNQSITLFYEFQSNLNGFLLNVTTNLAKSYANSPNTPAFGVYTIPSCPSGQTPFSSQCPGQLQQTNGFFFNQPKGRVSLANLRIAVSNGQWVGIALSAAFSGLDVNDTNTGITLFQTNEGKMPPIIQQGSSLGSSKMGLWAWITGNAIVGTTPPPLTQFNCAGFLDCLLPNWVGSFCALGAPSCLAVSGLVWALILAFVSTFFVGKYASELAPNTKVPIGEIFLLLFPTWIFVMAGLSLTFVWIPLFFFFAVSVAYGKHTGNYL